MPVSFFHLPLWVTGGLIIIGLCAYSLTGLALVRRFLMPRLRVSGEDSDFTGAMVQAVMVFYGLAVALVAVNVWENHSGVSSVVSLEASRLGGLYRDVDGYPEPVRDALKKELHGYADYVIGEAWPLQRQGGVPTGGVEWMDAFQATLFSFEPTTEGQQALHGEALSSFHDFMEARRLRLDATLVKLPPALWVMIVFGALISLASTFFFKVDDVRLHVIQVLLLSIFIGLVITLVVAFDRPFLGDLGIDSSPYRLVRDQLMRE
jgi:hypothetical protein